MSAAAVRSAYVPRTGSLPPRSPSSGSASGSGSAARRPAFNPRTPAFNVSSPQPVSEEAKRNAEAVLKLIGRLPAPIAFALPPPDCKNPPKNPPTAEFSSFQEYARAQKRKLSSDETPNGGLGLGLNLASSSNISSRPPLKKARTTDVVPGGSSAQPSRASLLSSPKNRSSLRNEITRGGTGKGDWTPEQWKSLSDEIGKRALQMKRLGDAYMYPAAAKGHLLNSVPQDKLRGLLLLTESLCYYLYRNFCDERVNRGVVSTSAYMQLDALRVYVRQRWDDHASLMSDWKEHIKGMQGLIYLMEAITSDVIARTDLRSLHLRMGKEISSSSTSGPSPSSSTASPAGNGRSPGSSSSELPADLLKLLNVAHTSSSSSQRALLQSRAILSLRLLKNKFPETYDRAINSDLADDILSGDTLGCARNLDIDDLDVFAWPIELGMQNGVAHIAVFGRSLVREFALAAGKPWDVSSSYAESPP
ncbi:hypothetical protein CC85DRAFT_305721 [Cutaneotrichosporon oleaginosum]|uniref:Uncharacterized protein n=1 Tax=Cutaneotrichosporon oleaginosum TaxID=879819 RepID=A0A0J0XCA0_9TREE|nr:uncharacterized protein CC85DRAFT_305721 [Cutaneotrichosporon oleaginosum]KLT38695.1 hypothetical protein CC85DRAFT_305721 [Cutaneotrichosporon oleaginosum]TXT07582.1 hypothetical protein COLE_04506 [Cutaneotrichosporon oleaginosum]